MHQTYHKLQIVLVDDGSTDMSGEICDRYVEIDSRFEVIHKSNEGVSIARNVGIAKAYGEYIVFVDSDDWVAPDYVEKLYTQIKNFSTDIVICGWFSCVFKQGQMLKQKRYEQALGSRKVYSRDKLLKQVVKPVFYNDQKRTAGLYSPCNKMYRLKFLRENEIKFTPNIVHEDYYFNLEVFSNIPKIVGIKDLLYFYFIKQGRESMHNRLHAGIEYLDWRNKYFTKNFPEISRKTKKYAKEVHKWFVSHRKNILTSNLSQQEKEEKIQLMDASNLYKWVLLQTGYTEEKTVKLANKKSSVVRIKELLKRILHK